MKIRCKIKPNSKKGNLIRKATDENGDFYEIFVRDPAVEGKANLAVIKLLAKEFNVSKSRVSLKTGTKSRFKIFEIKK
ncbi:DUF167 domain-containing protein [Candidatus Saccharibacteria bacterium]|nr:DUF167 domain-containing protein [Candidatus Saccharibacteria bacterium]